MRSPTRDLLRPIVLDRSIYAGYRLASRVQAGGFFEVIRRGSALQNPEQACFLVPMTSEWIALVGARLEDEDAFFKLGFCSSCDVYDNEATWWCPLSTTPSTAVHTTGSLDSYIEGLVHTLPVSGVTLSLDIRVCACSWRGPLGLGSPLMEATRLPIVLIWSTWFSSLDSGQDCADYTVLLWRSLEGLSSAGWNATPGTLRHCNGKCVTHGCREPRLSVTRAVRTETPRPDVDGSPRQTLVRERTKRV